MADDIKWTQSLRVHETKKAVEFHKAKDREDIVHYAQLLSQEKDRNESPAILQTLYVGDKVRKTFEQLQEEHKEQQKRLREQFGAIPNAAPFNPFVGNVGGEGEDEDEFQHTLIFSSGKYMYSQRITNPVEKGKFKRLRPLPCKAYSNHFLWSSKSIILEDSLRQLPILNDLSLEKLMDMLDKLTSGLSMHFVDVFWACRTGQARFFGLPATAKDSLGRLSNYTESMLRFNSSITKEAYREVEFDALVLTLVNDFSQMMKLVKSNVLLTKYSVLAPLRQSDREGEAKVEAQLLAVTTDNYIHTRPLCTAADLSLAMFELMDPKIFKAGLIHMPNLIPPKYERFTHGFYRFIYQLSSSDCSWQYISYNIPAGIRELKPFITGIYYSESSSKLNNFVPNKTARVSNCNLFFEAEPLPTASVPTPLERFAQQLCTSLINSWSKEEVLLSACIDIELCTDSESKKVRESMLPPHQLLPGCWDSFVYRVRHIHSIQTCRKLAFGRRKAVFGMDAQSTRFCRDFFKYYHEEMATLRSKVPRASLDTSGMPSVRVTAIDYARHNYLEDLSKQASDSSDSDTNSSPPRRLKDKAEVDVDATEAARSGNPPIAPSSKDKAATGATSATSTSATAADVAVRNSSPGKIPLLGGSLSTQAQILPVSSSGNRGAGPASRRLEHRESSVMLTRYRQKEEQELLQQQREQARLLKLQQQQELQQQLEQLQVPLPLRKSIFMAPEPISSAVSGSSGPGTGGANSAGNSASPARRGSMIRMPRTQSFLLSLVPDEEQIAKREQEEYRQNMNRLTDEHLQQQQEARQRLGENFHVLCEKNKARSYIRGNAAVARLLKSPQRSPARESLPKDLRSDMQQRLEHRDFILDEPFFQDEALEKRIDQVAATLGVHELLSGVDVNQEVAKLASPNKDLAAEEEGVEEGRIRLSARSPRYYQEHEEENRRAFDLLVQGIGGKVARRVQEAEFYRRLKEYVHRRRQQEVITMRQVRDLHILHHFQKRFEYSPSSSEDEDGGEDNENSEEKRALNDLLGDYANEEALQGEVQARAEEETANKAAIRPKSADMAEANTDLHQRLAHRVSIHRASVSEGSSRRVSMASTKKTRNSMFFSLNSVLLDGELIKEAEMDKKAMEDTPWEHMTDSISTVLPSNEDLLAGLAGEERCNVLSQVLEGTKEVETPGGRLWGVDSHSSDNGLSGSRGITPRMRFSFSAWTHEGGQAVPTGGLDGSAQGGLSSSDLTHSSRRLSSSFPADPALKPSESSPTATTPRTGARVLSSAAAEGEACLTAGKELAQEGQGLGAAGEASGAEQGAPVIDGPSISTRRQSKRFHSPSFLLPEEHRPLLSMADIAEADESASLEGGGQDISLLLRAMTETLASSTECDPFLQPPKPKTPAKISHSPALPPKILASKPHRKVHYVNPVAPDLSKRRPGAKTPTGQAIGAITSPTASPSMRLGVRGLRYSTALASPVSGQECSPMRARESVSEDSHRSHSTGDLKTPSTSLAPPLHGLPNRSSFHETPSSSSSSRGYGTHPLENASKLHDSFGFVLEMGLVAMDDELLEGSSELEAMGHADALADAVDLDADGNNNAGNNESLSLAAETTQDNTLVHEDRLVDARQEGVGRSSVLEMSAPEQELEESLDDSQGGDARAVPLDGRPSSHVITQAMDSFSDISDPSLPTFFAAPARPYPGANMPRRMVQSPNRVNRKLRSTKPSILVQVPAFPGAYDPFLVYGHDNEEAGQPPSISPALANLSPQITSPALVRKKMPSGESPGTHKDGSQRPTPASRSGIAVAESQPRPSALDGEERGKDGQGKQKHFFVGIGGDAFTLPIISGPQEEKKAGKQVNEA